MSQNVLKCQPRLTGTLWNLGVMGFRQGEENYRWNADQWSRELDDMQGLGLDTILLNGTRYCYERAREGAGHDTLGDVLEFLLAQGDRRGMHLILETHVSPEWWLKDDAPGEVRKTREFVRTLKERYGHHSSFWGWYLGYETYYIRDEKGTRFLQDIYRGLSEACHELDPGKPVMVSPFFMIERHRQVTGPGFGNPQEYGDWWMRMLKTASIDILALQDSGGEHFSCTTLEERRDYFEAMSAACEAAGTKFWGNVETGELAVASIDEYEKRFGAGTYINDKKTHGAWRAVPIPDLQRKMALAARYCEKLITWGYREFVRPSLGPEAERYYQEYRQAVLEKQA